MLTLRWGPAHTTVQSDFPNERRSLTIALSISDPDPSRNPEYKSGEWDGVHRWYNEEEDHFPSGLLDYTLNRLDEANVPYRLIGRPEQTIADEVPADILVGETLRPYQCLTIRKAQTMRRGIVRIGTGGGKTLVQAGLARRLDVPSLTIVQSIKSLSQTARRFKQYGLDVGRLSDEHRDLDCKHVVAMIQSLWSGLRNHDEDVRALLQRVQLLQGDEIHHLGSRSWGVVFSHCQAEYRIGYSGTPLISRDPRNPHPRDMQVMAYTGPLIVDIPTKWLRDQGYLEDPKIYMPRVHGAWIHPRRRHYNNIYRDGVVNNSELNSLGVRIAINAYRLGYHPLILVDRILHGEKLLRRLGKRRVPAFFSYGGQQVKIYDAQYPGVVERRCTICERAKRSKSRYCAKCDRKTPTEEVLQHKRTPVSVDADDKYLAQFKSRDVHVMIGITAVFQESMDLPYVDCLILLAGGKSYVNTLQRVGRAIRKSDAGLPVVVFDPRVMAHVYLISHGRKRAAEYQREEYRVYGNAPERFLEDV